ncbi:hypothetical protein Tco_0133395 [Tanacetum coccineum]
MFRETLSGATRNWFDDLDPMSVDSFEELSQKFLKEFSQQNRGCFRCSGYQPLRQNPELAKKLNDKIPKTVDEMFKRVRAFIRGEVAASTAEVTRAPQWDKGSSRMGWSIGHERSEAEDPDLENLGYNHGSKRRAMTPLMSRKGTRRDLHVTQ